MIPLAKTTWNDIPLMLSQRRMIILEYQSKKKLRKQEEAMDVEHLGVKFFYLCICRKKKICLGIDYWPQKEGVASPMRPGPQNWFRYGLRPPRCQKWIRPG